jgi:hypothetical protein
MKRFAGCLASPTMLHHEPESLCVIHQLLTMPDTLSSCQIQFGAQGEVGASGEPCVVAGLSFRYAVTGMQRKNVYIGDCLIGEAATWREVHVLTKAQGLFFIHGPRGAEGPSGFYLAAVPVDRSTIRLRNPAADYR